MSLEEGPDVFRSGDIADIADMIASTLVESLGELTAFFHGEVQSTMSHDGKEILGAKFYAVF